MTIEYLKDEDLIKVTADEIETFITDIDDYENITVSVNYCSSSVYKSIYSTTEILDTNRSFYIEDNILYIKPVFLSLSGFIDGVYKITIKFSKESSYTYIENCSFIDITYKCKVAQYLKDLAETNKQYNKSDKVSTIVHLLHYGLVNGSNCGCNCSEMCEVFLALQEILGITEIQNTNCGSC